MVIGELFIIDYFKVYSYFKGDLFLLNSRLEDYWDWSCVFCLGFYVSYIFS